MSRLAEYIAESAVEDSREIVRNRQRAASRSVRYEARLLFDSFAERRERVMIDKANKLIQLAAI